MTQYEDIDHNITITDGAREYLGELVAKQNSPGMGVRMYVTQPGTKNAETCLAYCKPDEIIESDLVSDYIDFRLYVERQSVPYLDEAVVDFAKDKLGGQLTIKAPNAKMPKVDENSPLQDRINYLLMTEVNPGLAAHGGEVSLVEVTEDMIAVLRFGGGCQGCSAVDVTLKNGVETRLLEVITELKGVRDVTDHTVTENAYYQ
ncbi:Fe-S biogenesis protein NfuA [Litoribrevibacter albus]|uniref:Fe/S biogenesis protein NfuA n=1 Tax=Litoribrevibacter albus TaxID=1473156 RepID=A0AA37SAM5_9GAMM|nr:Fe-S biogenesis protein NfuA [Litoribrevibacter albus]GLQ32265.1 Fe/S biogenesis protein NfuA [Litoribrevibacter albus]